MEIRLERSFADEQSQGGVHNSAMARLIVNSLAITKSALKRRWTDSEVAKEACRGAALKALEIAFGNQDQKEGLPDLSPARSVGEWAAVVADQETRNAEFETADWQERIDQAKGTLVSRALSNVGTLGAPKGLLAPASPDATAEQQQQPKTKRKAR